MRVFFASAVVAVSMLLGGANAMAAGVAHKLAVHVDENDPAIWNLALNNVEQSREFFESQGDTVQIEVVAYGPGLQMLVADSAVKERIAAMSLQSEDTTFSACNNTLQKLVKKVGHDVPLVSEARIVPGGVVRLMELQSEGYAYLKP
jgi:uncharacterized protein